MIKNILKIIEDEFEFLVTEKKFMKTLSVKDESCKPYVEYDVIYNNSLVEININFAVYERSLSIFFKPLDFRYYKNKKDEIKKLVTENMIYDLHDILKLRNPQLLEKIQNIDYPDKKDFEKKLKLFVEGLRSYTEDIINGNFNVFKDVIEIQNERLIEDFEERKELVDGYGIMKDGKLTIINDYKDYKKILDRQHEDIINNICKEIYKKLGEE